MIEVDNVLMSDDIVEKMFVCHLEKCKGACCVEGDLGAPLEDAERKELERAYAAVEPYLSEAGKKAIAEQGLYVHDEDGDHSTPTVGGRECAYAVYEANGTLKCGIEQAYFDGKTSFRKPVSCHLYPLRLRTYDRFTAVNYDEWDICAAACTLGESLGVPLYQFLEEALVRRFGQEWYDKLLKAIEAYEARRETERAERKKP